ncbi:MAG: hypothetical protein FWH08_07370 [Oscillospiraceae bacterium]|nr:hypothetical protein [Oscillospiraceae bacterium]
MYFIEFNIKWYKNRIEYYLSLTKDNINNEIINEAKILYKFLEDIYDEGYHSTYDFFQSEVQATKRLLSFIKLGNEKPFVIQKKSPVYGELVYAQSEKPLNEYLQLIINQANAVDCVIDNRITLYDEILPKSEVLYLHNITMLTEYGF